MSEIVIPDYDEPSTPPPSQFSAGPGQGAVRPIMGVV